MNRLFFLLLAPFLLLVSGSARLSAQVQTFSWQNDQREYILHLPANHDGTPPIVFYLHGLGENVATIDNNYNFSKIANDYGWAVVVPQAKNLGMGTMWSAALVNSDVDDVGFLLALLDTLLVQHQLDPDSVFFTGFSMGGFMTHRMAIEHGDRITACAPISGLIPIAITSLTPVSPVRLLHIHGTNDFVVGYDGGSQAFNMTLGLGVEAILDYWQSVNSCSGLPIVDTLPDLKNDGLKFIHYTYNCGTDLQHLKVVGGTHTLYFNEAQYDVSYWSVIHDFFVGNNGQSGVEDHEMGDFKVWPNPSSGLFHVEMDKNAEVQVIDMSGRVVFSGKFLAGNAQIDLRQMPDGLYLLKAAGRTVTKLVKE